MPWKNVRISKAPYKNINVWVKYKIVSKGTRPPQPIRPSLLASRENTQGNSTFQVSDVGQGMDVLSFLIRWKIAPFNAHYLKDSWEK